MASSSSDSKARSASVKASGCACTHAATACGGTEPSVHPAGPAKMEDAPARGPHMKTLIIHKLIVNQNYNRFALKSLLKIGLCSSL